MPMGVSTAGGEPRRRAPQNLFPGCVRKIWENFLVFSFKKSEKTDTTHEYERINIPYTTQEHEFKFLLFFNTHNPHLDLLDHLCTIRICSLHRSHFFSLFTNFYTNTQYYTRNLIKTIHNKNKIKLVFGTRNFSIFFSSNETKSPQRFTTVNFT